MAPEFNFIVSTEDNALVENVKARASANRQALGNRQELKKAETAVNTQATKNEAATRPGAIRPRRAPVEEELTATRRGGLKILNIVLGNGPARNANIERVTEWRATISGVPNTIWRSALFNDFISSGTAVPTKTEGLTYTNYRSRVQDIVDYVQREQEYIYGNAVDNVWIQLTGGTHATAAGVSLVGTYIPDSVDLRYYVVNRTYSTTVDLPAVIPSSWRYVEMPVTAKNVLTYLRNSGVNVDNYNLIFVSLNYSSTTPALSAGYGAYWYKYANTPAIRYENLRRDADSALVFTPAPDDQDILDPDSYPIHNLTSELDTPKTKFLYPSDGTKEHIVLGSEVPNTQTGIQQALNNAYAKKERLIVFATLGNTNTYTQIIEGVYRTTFVPGAASLSTRVGLNRRYRDWSLRDQIIFRYVYSYLLQPLEYSLDLTSLPTGFENSDAYESTYGPYYNSVLNRRTI